MNYLIYFLIFFGSYAIGRVSHILGGHLKSPHHWIYGLLLLIVGLIYMNYSWSVYAVAFGVGFIISDLKDMIDLKFYGVDDVKVKKFWGID